MLAHDKKLGAEVQGLIRIPLREGPASGGVLGRHYQMRFSYFAALISAAAISLAMVGGAAAQGKTVKIGGVFPLSGNAASAGVHAKYALEVAMDIINNAHP